MANETMTITCPKGVADARVELTAPSAAFSELAKAILRGLDDIDEPEEFCEPSTFEREVEPSPPVQSAFAWRLWHNKIYVWRDRLRVGLRLGEKDPEMLDSNARVVEMEMTKALAKADADGPSSLPSA